MGSCARGHRVVDSTGECTTPVETSPGHFSNVSAPCDEVQLLIEGNLSVGGTREAMDWATRQAVAWLELGRPPGRSPSSCPLDEYKRRRECAHCLAELLRQVADLARDAVFERPRGAS